jgi:hypothetical protein
MQQSAKARQNLAKRQPQTRATPDTLVDPCSKMLHHNSFTSSCLVLQDGNVRITCGNRYAITRRALAALMIATLLGVLSFHPRPARASIFDDIGDGLATVTGLRGVIRGLASGAGEGVREQLDRFVDEKVDPLIARVDQVMRDRIDQAKDAALQTVRALQDAMNDVIDKAAHHAEQLTQQFFDRLDATLDATFGRLENLIDDTLCKVMPDGSISINLGPFGGADSIKVRRPLRTHCYRHYLAAQGDPGSATFKRYEFFAGELCEYELKLGRINPESPDSMKDAIAGYDKLAEMANTARCAAPTPTAKAEMVQKLLLYQTRAGLLRQISHWR